MQYLDIILRARDWQPGAFLVEVTQSPLDRMREPEKVRYNEGWLAARLHQLERKQIRQPELIELGRELARLLLPAQARQLLHGSLARLQDGQSLRLRLALDDPRIAALPWEYLYFPLTNDEPGLAGFLALNPKISLVRHEAVAGEPPPSVAAWPPLRVLAAFAAPRTLAPLDLHRERQNIEQALQTLPGVQLDCAERLTLPLLEEKLRGGVHLFHFAGHGSFDTSAAAVDGTRHLNPGKPAEAAPSVPVVGQGVLVLEDEQGGDDSFDAERLGLSLAAAGTRVAVLGACETGRRDGVNVWSGSAPALLRAGLAGVVAMQYKIYDQAAVCFARGFYDALAKGLSLDEAVLQGRLSIIHLDDSCTLDFGVPVLYLRAHDSVVFPEFAAVSELTLVRERDYAAYIEQATRDFTGGAWVFQALDEWLGNSAAAPVFLLTGEPGAGKTAIAARLAQFSQGEPAPPGLTHLRRAFLSGVHFCSRQDYGWHSPRSFIETLVHQLAQRHPVFRHAWWRQATAPQPHHLSVEEEFTRQLREPLETLLRATGGQPVVILVDALDEALHPDETDIVQLLAGLRHLPRGLRLILTSRPELHVEELFSTFPPPVSFSLADQRYADARTADVNEYIRQRFDHSQALAVQAAQLKPDQWQKAAQQMAKRAAGNLQYLRFLLDKIARGERSLLELQGLPAGLDGLYAESLRRVTDRQAATWKQIYQPLLGVLAAAQTGLTLAQLQHFTGQSETEVWDGLDKLWQFIRPTPSAGAEKERYQLYHQSLADFLQRSQVGSGNQRRNRFQTPTQPWHRRIADHFWAAYRDNWRDCDEYGLRFLSLHLQSLNDYERLCTLVDCRDWYEAKLALTADYDAYLADVNVVWEMASTRDTEQVRQGQPASELGREVRCALTVSSLGGLSEKIPPALLRAFVAEGFWTLENAAAASQRIPDAYRRGLALASLSALSPNDEFRAELARCGLQAASGIDYPWSRAEARFKLAPGLPEAERQRAEHETFDAILALDYENRKTDSLAWIAALLPEAFLPAAFTTALHFEGGYNREKTLAALAPRLSPESLQQAIDLLTDEQGQGSPALLAAQLSHLPEAERADKARLILAQASALEDEYRRDVALRLLAPQLSGELLTEAARLARRKQQFHTDSLTAFARRFAELGEVEEALHMLRWLSLPALSSLQQVDALAAVLELLPAAHLPALQEIVREISHPYWQAEGWGLLACAFPGQVARADLQAALAARRLNDADSRAHLLATLAVSLPEQYRRTAFAALKESKDHFTLSQALPLLAPHLPKDLREPALALAKHLDKDSYEAHALAALVPVLPKHSLKEVLEQSQHWHDVSDQLTLATRLAPRLSAALSRQAIEHVRWRWRDTLNEQTALLCAFLPGLPDDQLQELLAVARALQGNHARYSRRLMAALFQYLSAEEQSTLLNEVLPHSGVAYLAEWDKPPLAALAVYLAEQGQPDQAFSLVTRLHTNTQPGEEWATQTLLKIAPWLKEEQLPEVCDWARWLPWEGYIQVLAQLKARLPDDPLAEWTSRILNAETRPADKAGALLPLLPHLPTERRRALWRSVLAWTETIEDLTERRPLLLKLGDCLRAERDALPRAELYALWDSELRRGAQGRREELLDTLRVLAPVLEALGGTQALAETFVAVQETGRWWQ